MALKIKRLAAGFTDLLIASAIVLAPTFVGIKFGKFEYVKYIVLLILLMLKDISGRSLGKRVFGLTLVKTRNNANPSLIILILRNILFLLWIIDVILIFSLKKKICDYLFHTDVIDSNDGIINNFIT